MKETKSGQKNNTQPTKENKNQITEFSFQISFLRGIILTFKGYEESAVINIMQNLFSFKRLIFCILLLIAIAIILFVSKEADWVINLFKAPP